MRDCTSEAQSYCLGYVSGLVDGAFVEADFRKVKPLFELPHGVELGQLVDVVTKYLKDHPEIRHERADVLAFAALKAAFPPKP